MATFDVRGCVSAVVSAFHGGADLVQSIKDRRVKKRRMKQKDLELAFEEKMLHKALVDAESQCQATCKDRSQRFDQAFAIGDAIATTQLKDVMISLQAEVINALQIGRAVENATLDLSRLHEAVIANKHNAIRAMDDLCQRLSHPNPNQSYAPHDGMVSPCFAPTAESYPPSAGHSHGSRESFDSQGMTGMSIPSAVSFPEPPRVPIRSPARRTSISNVKDSVPRRSLTKTLKERSSGWLPQIRRLDSQISDLRGETLKEESEQQDTITVNRIHRVSLQDSAIGSSTVGSAHRPSASVTSILYSEDERRGSCATADSFEQPEEFYKMPNATQQTISSITERKPETTCGLLPSASIVSARIASPPPPLQWESPDDIIRANLAPEVVTADSKPLLSPRSPPTSPTCYPNQNIHPAFRNPYTLETPVALFPEPDNSIWAPLPRPAKLNNYHNFCKGAWQTRTRLDEGLSISLAPKAKGNVVPHWKCKQCAFRSKAMNKKNIVPNDVYTTSRGIRYRWLFLAKSHVPTDVVHKKPEDYSYGCIFCAAQGQETAVHEGLEDLIGHIVKSHKASMLTPEVLEKTGCVVGGAPAREDGDWDVHLPEGRVKSFGGFFARAV